MTPYLAFLTYLGRPVVRDSIFSGKQLSDFSQMELSFSSPSFRSPSSARSSSLSFTSTRITLVFVLLGAMYGSSHAMNGNMSEVATLTPSTSFAPAPEIFFSLIFFLSLT